MPRKASKAAETPPAKRDSIKKALMDQVTNDCHKDLIEDYMAFWDMKEGLHADIRTRGLKVRKYDSRGQEQIANNESIEHAIKVNVQMLKILSELGITAMCGGEDEL